MNTVFPYKTFGGWVRSLGIKVSDLTPEELEDAKREFELRKAGEVVLDGLESYVPTIRRRREYTEPMEEAEILDGGIVSSI